MISKVSNKLYIYLMSYGLTYTLSNLTDAEFTRMFRLNRASFYYLLYKISPLIEIKENSINNFNVP